MNSEKRPNPSSERSKKWLTESLLELLKQKPYSKITIQDISKEADLVRQTFYKNYDKKDDILENHIENLFINFANEFFKENKFDMKNFMKSHLNFWAHNSEFLVLLIDNNLTYLLDKQYKKHIPDLVDALIPQKTDRASPKHKYALAFLSGALVNILEEWVYYDQEYNVDELSSLINTIMLGQYFSNL
jgi:AcrR family transcriptional regulator